MAPSNRITLRLEKRERELLLKYGYPFEDLEQQLERTTHNNHEVPLSIHPDDAERLIADLVYSARKLTDRGLLRELDALMTKIEHHVRFHDGRGIDVLSTDRTPHR